jgi:hypothetical protein
LTASGTHFRVLVYGGMSAVSAPKPHRLTRRLMPSHWKYGRGITEMTYRLIRHGDVKTRKRHRCEWCNEVIDIGSTVPSRTYFWEGAIQTAYMHPECWKAMESADQQDLEEGWTPGDFERGKYE